MSAAISMALELLRQASADELAEIRLLLGIEPATPEPAPDGQWLTPAEAAATLGVHVETIRRKARSGELGSIKVGSALRIDVESLTMPLAAAFPPSQRARSQARRRPSGRRTLRDALDRHGLA